jgi:hypothetical protein
MTNDCYFETGPVADKDSIFATCCAVVGTMWQWFITEHNKPYYYAVIHIKCEVVLFWILNTDHSQLVQPASLNESWLYYHHLFYFQQQYYDYQISLNYQDKDNSESYDWLEILSVNDFMDPLVNWCLFCCPIWGS